MDEPFRVIQWATGPIGSTMVRTMLRKRSVEVVGAIVHSREKVGRDLGELVGMSKVGITASDDADEVLKTAADVVMIATPAALMNKGSWNENVEQISKALKAKKNVITVSGFIYPWKYCPEIAQQLDCLAKENGVSLLGTGLNPGFLFDYLTVVLSGCLARVDRIIMRHCEDETEYDSLPIMRDMLGFGRSPEEYEKRHFRRLLDYQTALFAECAHFIADSVGWELTELKPKLEVFTAKEPLQISCMRIDPGTVCAYRFVLQGLKEKDIAISIEFSGVVCPDKVKDVGEPGQTIWFEGLPTYGVELKGNLLTMGFLSTAAHAVNAIPRVIKAPPWLVSLKDLPVVVPIR